MRLSLVAGVLFLAAGAAPVEAQTTGTLAGRITDAVTDEPLPLVAVTVVELRRTAGTGEDGSFVLAAIPPGVYAVRAELLGYRTRTAARVVVRAGRRTTLDLEMSVEALELEPLAVEAERVPLIEPEVSETHHVVVGRELRELPVDATEAAVELAPGVTDGHFRGGRVGQETYVVDGFAVKNQLEASAQGLGLEYAPTALEEVEVTTGGFGSEHGSALSGVVSYVTRRGDRARWDARASLLTDQYAPDGLLRGFTQLSASAGGPVAFLGRDATLFADLQLQGMLDAEPRARGLTCLRAEDVEPALAAEIDAMRSDPSTRHLYCPYSGAMLPHQRGDKLIAFLRLDRPLWTGATLSASFLGNRLQRQLYTPEFKYNAEHQLGQRRTGALAAVTLDWAKDARGKAFHLTARAAAMRLDRYLGVLDPESLDGRTGLAGFGLGDFRFLGEEFVRQPINDQLATGQAVPGYVAPGGSAGSPFGPGADGIFVTEGTPGLASWSRSELLGADVVAEWLSAGGTALRTGSSVRLYRVESYERARAYFAGSIPNYARFYPATLAGFAEARVATEEIFQATLGVRVEGFRSGLSFQPDRSDFLAPTVDTGWKLALMPRVGFAGAFENSAGRTSFRFSFTRIAQPPDFRFFLDTTVGDSLRTDIRRQGNPDLAFEQGRAFELGVSHLLNERLGLSVSAYRKELTRLVTGSLRFSGLAPNQFSTGDRGTVQGLEVSVRGAWDGVTVRGGYTLQRATGVTSGALEESPDTTAQFHEFPLAFDRTHAIDAAVWMGRAAGAPGTPWGAALTASVQSGYPLDRRADEVERLPWTADVHLRMSRELGGLPRCRGCRVRVVGDVRNVLGRDNVIALRRDTGGLGPTADALRAIADEVPADADPIPREWPEYSPLADLDGDGRITADELREARFAAALDRHDPSLFFGEPLQVRIGFEVSF